MRFDRGLEQGEIRTRFGGSEKRLEEMLEPAYRPRSSADSRNRAGANDPLEPVPPWPRSFFPVSTQRRTADPGT
jgi:hypothetical protein